MALAKSFTKTWSGPGSESSTSSTTSGLLGSTRIAARHLVLIVLPLRMVGRRCPKRAVFLPLKRCLRRYRNTSDAGSFDRFRNQPGRFAVFDEFPQVSGSSGAAFDNTEGLLNCHKPAVEHP